MADERWCFNAVEGERNAFSHHVLWRCCVSHVDPFCVNGFPFSLVSGRNAFALLSDVLGFEFGQTCVGESVPEGGISFCLDGLRGRYTWYGGKGMNKWKRYNFLFIPVKNLKRKFPNLRLGKSKHVFLICEGGKGADYPLCCFRVYLSVRKLLWG